MDNHNLPKSPAQPSGMTQVPDNTYRRIKARKLTRHLTCPLCETIFKEATTINECNHTFCEECIYKKVQEGITSCPECNLDLSDLDPENYLRPDTMIRGLIKAFLQTSLSTEPPPTASVIESTNEGNASEADGKCKNLKKKRDKKRKCRQFSSSQNKDKGTDEPDNEWDKSLESNIAGLCETVTSKEENIEDLSESEVFNEDKKKSSSVWFRLVPQADETGHVYPMLANSYIYTKNGDANASIINKLLVKKLNLESEDEVEVCFGKQIIIKKTLSNLMDDWVDRIIGAPPEYLSSLEPDDRLMMKLTYRRKKPACPNKSSVSGQSSG
ncbi:hypothetical protein Acr_00g0085360 [Actinidia rufa]|uniref:RING-type domain-containing protein n=1 Tax=Actinidia rufa TaxID=165716 RepID=A0A7J0DVL8_9ERIC|nr:hypothetical protein Acr_00g0085360 [Actinidia rufa]